VSRFRNFLGLLWSDTFTGLRALGINKDVVAAFKDIVTLVALVIAGVWTIMLTSVYRETNSRIEIAHHISHKSMPEHRSLLIVDVQATNTGKVLVRQDRISVAIFQMLPVEGELLKKLLNPAGSARKVPDGAWTEIFGDEFSLQGRTMEPNEREQYVYEFVLDDSVKLVEVYTFLRDEVRSRPGLFVWFKELTHWQKAVDHSYGWERRSIYDLQTSASFP
jgi:hypothetical protein